MAEQPKDETESTQWGDKPKGWGPRWGEATWPIEDIPKDAKPKTDDKHG